MIFDVPSPPPPLSVSVLEKNVADFSGLVDICVKYSHNIRKPAANSFNEEMISSAP